MANQPRGFFSRFRRGPVPVQPTQWNAPVQKFATSLGKWANLGQRTPPVNKAQLNGARAQISANLNSLLKAIAPVAVPVAPGAGPVVLGPATNAVNAKIANFNSKLKNILIKVNTGAVQTFTNEVNAYNASLTNNANKTKLENLRKKKASLLKFLAASDELMTQLTAFKTKLANINSKINSKSNITNNNVSQFNTAYSQISNSNLKNLYKNIYNNRTIKIKARRAAPLGFKDGAGGPNFSGITPGTEWKRWAEGA
jgi:hypothetical protein